MTRFSKNFRSHAVCFRYQSLPAAFTERQILPSSAERSRSPVLPEISSLHFSVRPALNRAMRRILTEPDASFWWTPERNLSFPTMGWSPRLPGDLTERLHMLWKVLSLSPVRQSSGCVMNCAWLTPLTTANIWQRKWKIQTAVMLYLLSPDLVLHIGISMPAERSSVWHVG